ncbi:hypothetical protein AWH62_08595 [Maricaulis sp. W15]|uniref:hypothetical protein n=1 Tax=Maricaulis sp. W15 TaxID=1772333 RepID=UPI0009627038|nr:hypothetical protein [Maricaulis sp. W15]OLF73003.1 hypothetical protein AWH62_08595 [Maricaulis sp. W15]
MARLSIMDRIGITLAGGALIAVGVVIRAGLLDIADRMPLHREIGTAFLALGVLTLLANVSVRVKSLVIILITGGWAAAAIWAAVTMSDLFILQRGLIGLTGVLAAIFAISSIPKLVTGEDAAD